MTDNYLRQNIEVLQEFLQSNASHIAPAVFPNSVNNSLRKAATITQLCRDESPAMVAQLKEFLERHSVVAEDLCISTSFDFDSRTVTLMGVLPVAPDDIDNEAAWRAANKQLNSLEEMMSLISNSSTSTSSSASVLDSLINQFLSTNNLNSNQQCQFTAVYNAAWALKMNLSHIPDLRVRMNQETPFIVSTPVFNFISQNKGEKNKQGKKSEGKDKRNAATALAPPVVSKGKRQREPAMAPAETAELELEVDVESHGDVDADAEVATQKQQKRRKHKAKSHTH